MITTDMNNWGFEEFELLFSDYMKKKREEMRVSYNRILPSGELIFNRFDKANYINAGTGSSIYDTCAIFGDVKIGDHVWVGPYTILDGNAAKLTIGNFVSVNAGVMIYTHDSTEYYLSGGKMPFKKGEVSIGDNTVIGTMAIVSYDVKIGEHCVIAANSFVRENVDDYSIVAGVPAKKIGEVNVQDDGKVQYVYY